MWRLLTQSSAAVMLTCVGVLSLVSWHSGHGFEWRPIFAFSAIGTALFATRSYFLLRKHRAVQLHRLQAERDAMQELIDDMARLSLGDLSLYVMFAQRPDLDTACIVTSGGSPNHRVLVQMTDLGLAAPERMETMGNPSHSFVCATYRLNGRGRASLGSLLKLVAKRRHWFAAQDVG